MTSLLLLTAMFSALFIGQSLAATSYIIPPIRSSGPEAAVIFVPGARIDGKAYEATARAIQAASNIRLWVALTGNYTLNNMATPLDLPGAMRGAYAKLQKAGMKGDKYVGVGHSLGGVFLPPYAKHSPLKAVVLLGAYLTKGNSLSEYPLPVLTLSAELDGQTRITRIAETYEELLKDISTAPASLYRTPVLNIAGACHAQFASGKMPATVVKYDLHPDISEAAAHRQIGQHVSDFLTVSLQIGDVTKGKAALRQAFNDAGTRFKPLLSVKALDKAGEFSPWSIRAQKVLAADLQGQLKVSDKIEDGPQFQLHRPQLSHTDDRHTASVTTYTHISYDNNLFDIATHPAAPRQMVIKFQSYDAIHHFLNVQGHSTNRGNATCRQLNELAISVAFNSSTPAAQRRYKTSGRPILLADDKNMHNGISFDTTSLTLNEQDDGLHVQSVAMKLSTDSPLFPGVFDCKLLSPYRAMEWMNVDSLRAKKPAGDLTLWTQM